jgi:uncharacterized protein (TIGR02569 family)
MTTPPPDVLEAFGSRGVPVALPGGEGLTFRVNNIVLKQVHDTAEAEWTQALLSKTAPDGFRIAEPIPAVDQRWVYAGWSASRFIDGLGPRALAWDAIADAGLRFADAVERVRVGGREILERRTHRWAVADRVAWGEARVDLDPRALDVVKRLSAWSSDAAREEHFVHGDLSGNVYFDQSGVPVVLDVSPYLRPRRWAVAIVIADAVLWSGADVSLARTFAADHDQRDLFARALIFRLVAEQLAGRRHDALLHPYRYLTSALI